jgi:polyisoprenoid-binding protein YceI
MRPSIRSLALVLGLVVPTLGHAATWEVDPVHSTVGFAIRHMMISTVRGHFRTFTATATGDPAAPTAATIVATIDATTIDTANEKRDTHLKTADFLDVEKFPTIAFTSKKIESAGQGKVKVTGDLTLHGVTKQVVVDVEGPTPTIKDPMGNTKAGAHATARINRKDFGIVWNKAMDGGGIMLGEEIDISIDIEAVKKSD